MPILKNIPLKLPMKEVLARLQFKRGKTEIDLATQNLLEKIGQEALTLIEPQAIYETIQIKKHNENVIQLENELDLKSRQIAVLLEPCSRLFLFACTIGPLLGQRVSQYESEGNILQATILDAYGSELADETADYINKLLSRQMFNIAATLTRRYSPGYGDWSLDVQPEILTHLKADQIGLSISTSNILIPEKSVTSLIGINDVKVSVCPNCK